MQWPPGVPGGEGFLLLLWILPARCFQGLHGGPQGHLGTLLLLQPQSGNTAISIVHFHKSGVSGVQKRGPPDQQVWCGLPENARKTVPGTRGWACRWRALGSCRYPACCASFLVPRTPCLRPECDIVPWKHLLVPGRLKAGLLGTQIHDLPKLALLSFPASLPISPRDSTPNTLAYVSSPQSTGYSSTCGVPPPARSPPLSPLSALPVQTPSIPQSLLKTLRPPHHPSSLPKSIRNGCF